MGGVIKIEKKKGWIIYQEQMANLGGLKKKVIVKDLNTCDANNVRMVKEGDKVSDDGGTKQEINEVLTITSEEALNTFSLNNIPNEIRRIEKVNKREAEYVLSLKQDEFYKKFPRKKESMEDEHGDARKMSNDHYYYYVMAYLHQHLENDFKGIDITYKQSFSVPNGRYFAQDPVALQRVHRPLRHFLCQNLYHDYDMRSAHLTILCSLCEEHNLPTKETEFYIANREQLLETWGKSKTNLLAYLNQDDPFKNFTKRKIDGERERYRPKNGLGDLLDEWLANKAVLYEHYSQRLHGNKTNPISSVMNKVFCEVENEWLMNVVENLDDSEAQVLMFDGFMVEDAIDIDDDENDYCQWEEKPIKSYIEIPEDFEFDAAKFEMPSKPTKQKQNVGGLMLSDKMACEKILELYPHIVTDKNDLYIFDETTGIWDLDEKFETFKKILMKHETELYCPLSEGEQKKGVIKGYGCTGSLIGEVCKLIKSLTKDATWRTRTEDSSKYKLLFKNGIYDFRTKKFKPGFDPNVVFFDNIAFDFPVRNQAKIDEVNKEFFEKPFKLEQIKNGVPKYMKQRFAKGVAGEHVKDFHFGLGVSNAGKSKLAVMFGYAFENYVGTFDGAELCGTKANVEASRADAWAYYVRNKRVIFSNEIKMGSVMNGVSLKRITGGDPVTARGLFKDPITFVPKFMMCLFANDLPKIDPLDKGVLNRARCLSYEKKFVEPNEELEPDVSELMDVHFDEKMKTQEFKDAFVHLILEAFTPDRLEVPKDMLEAFKDWTQGMSPEETFFESYEKADDGFVSNAEFEDWRKISKITMSAKAFAMFMTGLGFTSDRKKGKRGWVGVREIQEMEE